MSEYRKLQPGDPAPWFNQRNTSNPAYAFDTVAGRYIVMCFFATAGDALGQAALGFVAANRRLFDDDNISFFGISLDPRDEQGRRVAESMPGIRHFWDFDGKISRLYGVLPLSPDDGEQIIRRLWVVLDPGLNVLAVQQFQPDGSDHAAIMQVLQKLPALPVYAGFDMHAPILMLPRVFEPELCAHLIGLYQQHGGEVSGFMQEVDGKTVGAHDTAHKRRDDFQVPEGDLRTLIQRRIQQRVRPLIRRAFSFEASRMERYIVGCYDSQSGGHFRAHRDNTTKGTAHRRFALSLNLNDDFDGGDLGFPEYGPRTYKIPAGCGIVFSGALLHSVTAVRRGQRYAFLPFLYDDAAAQVREQNSQFLANGAEAYKA